MGDHGTFPKLNLDIQCRLVYREGALVNSATNVSLTGEVSERTRKEKERGGADDTGQKDQVNETDDLDQLADELEDILDNLGVYN